MPRRFAVAVFGQSEVLYSKWSARVQGDMWVNQRRDPLAQRGRWRSLTQDILWPKGHRPSGREHERARFSLECPLGANPRTGFRQGTPYAAVGRWYEKYGAGTPRVGRDGPPEKWPMRKGQADEVLAESLVKGTKRKKPKPGTTGSTWAKEQSD